MAKKTANTLEELIQLVGNVSDPAREATDRVAERQEENDGLS